MNKRILVLISFSIVLIASGGIWHSILASDLPIEIQSANLQTQTTMSSNYYYFVLNKKLHPQDGAIRFGEDPVIVEQDTLFVGDNDTSDGGSVYIFMRNQGGAENWGLTKTVTSTLSTGNNSYFGKSLDYENDTLAVGNSTNGSGSVSIFERDQGGAENWGLMKIIDCSDLGNCGGDLGAKVVLHGDTIAASQWLDYYTTGAVILERNQGGDDNWGLTKVITYSKTQGHGGINLEIYNDTLFIADPTSSPDGVYRAGSVYVYERDEGGPDNWGYVGILTGGLGQGYNFGTSMAIEGDTLVVGEPDYGYDSGAAWVFYRDVTKPNHWVKLIRLSEFETGLSHCFGKSVAIEGDMIVVGAPGDRYSSLAGEGSVTAFTRNYGGQDNWGAIAFIKDPTGNDEDYFGIRVSLSGDTLAIGAHGDDDFGIAAGSVHIFDKHPLSMIYLPIVVR